MIAEAGPGRAVVEAGGARAIVEGGPWLSVTSLVVGGRERLVMPDELPEAYRVHGARAGVTLLHPWANRLSGDDGLPPGAPRDPAGAPIHGLPAGEPGWTLAAADDSTILATLGASWPVDHRVTVGLVLDGGGLHVTTELRAAKPMPVAFGWHPYLRPAGGRASWRLVLPERQALALDDRGLPTGGRTALPAEDAPLGDRELDDAVDGLAPGTVLACGDLEVVLEAGWPAAHVFAPGDADVVSLEPMAAPVDGWRSGTAQHATGAVARWALRVAG